MQQRTTQFKRGELLIDSNYSQYSRPLSPVSSSDLANQSFQKPKQYLYFEDYDEKADLEF